MAGLLDYLASTGDLGRYIRDMDNATVPFIPKGFPGTGSQAPVLFDLPTALGKLDRATGSSFIGGLVDAAPQALEKGDRLPMAGDLFSQRFGAFQPPAEQPAQPPAPTAGAAYSPQVAQQLFNTPTGSYQFGGQMVPTFGQPQTVQAPQPVDAVSAQRRAPDVAIPAQAASPAAPQVAGNPVMDFLSAIRPGFVGRYEAKKTQQQNAQNLSTFFQGQGMSPQQANAMAAVAAQNPKIMEEFFKQPSTVEGAIARDMAFGTGGGGQGNAQTRALDWMRNKNAAEKAGTVQGESQATAQIDLPGAVATAKEQLRLIGELRNHEGRNQYGWHDYLGKAPLIPSTKGFDADNLLQQIKSGAFMTAFQTLKGGGQITEKEGAAATAAIARMDRATSKAEFEKALSDYEGIIKIGIDRANQKAGQPAPYGFQGNQGWGTLPGGARFKQVSP